MKNLTVAITAALLLILLAGCSSKTSTEQNTPQESENQDPRITMARPKTFDTETPLADVEFMYSDSEKISQIPLTLYEICQEYGFTDICTFYDRYWGEYKLSLSVPSDPPQADMPRMQIYVDDPQEDGKTMDYARNHGFPFYNGNNFWTGERFDYSDNSRSFFVDGVWIISDSQIAELASQMEYILNNSPIERGIKPTLPNPPSPPNQR